MANPTSLVGTWRLRSWTIARPDGTLHHPYGQNVVGYLTYTTDGTMSAEIMDPDRLQSDPHFPLQPASDQTLSAPDRARAYSTYLSYCGTFTVEGDVVTHHVKAGLVPAWTGSDQVRHFRLENGTLVIASGGQTLVWERAVPPGPEFRRLAEGVYALLQPPLVWYSSAGVIVGDRDVVLVDTLTNAAMTRTLQAGIRRVTDRPVRFLINTHAHADHVYTNHLFPEATVICTHRGRERTRANREAQERHTSAFLRLFPDVDFEGGRYTLQDLAFSGTLTLWQGEREIRLLELGEGHSESDLVVHLPAERIVFCGDLFLNGLPPLPSEGHVTQTIANLQVLEGLGADIYVAGHGEPGTQADVRAQRERLQRLFDHARECHHQGLTYDQALRVFAEEEAPLGFTRLALLASWMELSGRHPETADPASRDHLALLQGLAAEARQAWGSSLRGRALLG